MAGKKPTSWNEIRQRAAAFSRRWEDATEENAEAQTFWNELLQVYGIDRKRVAVFEKRALRMSTQGRGRIDLFFPGVLVAEQKSAGKSLQEAERQALDYVDSLPAHEQPALIVTSDFQKIRVLDLTPEVPAQSFTFALSDFSREADRLGILAGYTKRNFSAQVEETANIKAAKIMASLYLELERSGCNDHTSSVLLARLLFLLFADDTGIQEKDLFKEWVQERTIEDGSDLGSQLALLFQTLNRHEDSRSGNLDESFARFPYVNGGIFSETLELVSFDKKMRDALLKACRFDWGSISPAVFGSMFQAVKDKKARTQLGEHYTTETNILKVLQPILLDELEAELLRGWNSPQILRNLKERLGRIKVLDPACGCGNFLIVAYRELRDLERRIIARSRELSGDAQTIMDVTSLLNVRLHNFFGIELEEWPAQVAETALFLVEHQANLKLSETLGIAPDPLPILDSATIVRGNALHMLWSDVVKADDDLIIVGNPPFVGMSKMSAEQQDDNRLVFAGLDKKFRTGRLDYVACWYLRAMEFMKQTRAKAAFVSTNSISQGEQARTLNPLFEKFDARIDFAHRTFNWTSEAPDAANVHCVIIGFSMVRPGKHSVRLFDYVDLRGEPIESDVPYLNSYLFVSDLPVPGKRRTPFIPSLPPMRQGSKPWDGGGLVVKLEHLSEIEADEIASTYMRPYFGSDEMISGGLRWCLWLDGVEPHVMRKSPFINSRLERVVEARRGTKTVAVQKQAATPWLFSQRRQPSQEYLAIPEVSSNRREYIPMRFYPASVIASNKLMTIEGPPPWLAAILMSAWFTLWVKTFAGRLKSDPSVSPDLTYNTFPFPPLSEKRMEDLGQALANLLSVREAHEGSSLDDLYDPLFMPVDVRNAHRTIDRLVDLSFGLRSATDSRRLTVMLERFHELAKSDQGRLKDSEVA